MPGMRLPEGGRIDRTRDASFFLDRKKIQALQGDTLASALLASGDKVFARSFKYHRPRGVMSDGVAEANVLLSIGEGAAQQPNLPATQVEAASRLKAFTQNAWPHVKFDIRAVHDFISPLLVAGFYYKTFMGLGKSTKIWMFFEYFIRRAAGLGVLEPSADPARYEWQHDFCDVLIVGSGAAGLSAALAAALQGLDVILVEQDFVLGGTLLQHHCDSEASRWLQKTLKTIADTGKVHFLTRATAFGLYDSQCVGVVERSSIEDTCAAQIPPKERLHFVQYETIILACGAIEQPLVFAGNDRPGVMLASAVASYVNRYAVQPGQNALFCVNNDQAYHAALALAQTGARVCVADVRSQLSPALVAATRQAHIEVLLEHGVAQAYGRHGVRQARIGQITATDEHSKLIIQNTRYMAIDLLAVSAGSSPCSHLAAHRGEKPVFQEHLGNWFFPTRSGRQWVVGSMAGCLTWQNAIETGWHAALEAAQSLGKAIHTSQQCPLNTPYTLETPMQYRAEAVLHDPTATDKCFIDFQHDVHVHDLELALREGYQSSEHWKRYTTLTMATDQGKTAQLNALNVVANQLKTPLAAQKPTTYRPPFTPITIGALAGRAIHTHYRLLRKTPLSAWHETQHAVWTEVGMWRRALWYASNGKTMDQAYREEMRFVREGTAMCDISTLGKIDVQGIDAAEFLDRVYVNCFSTLAIGKTRYGIILREDGMLLDDGTTTRWSDHDFFMTTTTSQAAQVMQHLEWLLQTQWPTLRVSVTSSSDQWAALSIAGKHSREILQAAFPFMHEAIAQLTHMGAMEHPVAIAQQTSIPLRLLRLTFSGELAYEIYIPSFYGQALWQYLLEVGKPYALKIYGLEALASLRIEKGHITGSEIDGRVVLSDVGLAKLAKKQKAYWGSALAKRPQLQGDERMQLIGLSAIDAQQPPNNGAILFFSDDALKGVGRGYVTSNCYSASLEKSIALGFLQGGLAHIGKEVLAVSPVHQRQYRLRVEDPCFIDPAGERYRI